MNDAEDEPWAQILDYTYQNGGLLETENVSSHSEGPNVATSQPELNHLADIEQVKAMSLLKRANLVEEGPDVGDIMDDRDIFQLTGRGFDVAHERRLAKQDQRTNENLSFFTLILAFAAITQGIAAAIQLQNPSESLSILLVLMLLLILMCFYLANGIPRLRNMVQSLWPF